MSHYKIMKNISICLIAALLIPILQQSSLAEISFDGLQRSSVAKTDSETGSSGSGQVSMSAADARQLLDNVLDKIREYELPPDSDNDHPISLLVDPRDSNPELMAILNENNISSAAYTRYCAAKSIDIETKAALGSWIVSLQQKAGGSPAASEPEAEDVSGAGAQQSLDNALDEIREYALPSGLFINYSLGAINKFMNDNPELSKILTDNGISIITYMRFRQAKIENGATEQDVNAWLMDLQQKAGQAPVTGKSSAINDVTGKYGSTADSGNPADNTAQTTGGYNVTAIDPGIMNIIYSTSDTEDSGGGGGTLWNGPATGDNIYTTKLSDYLTDYYGLPIGLTYEDLAAMGLLDDVKKDYVPLDPDRAGPQSGDGTGSQQGDTTDQGTQGTDTAGDSTGQDNTGENGTTDDPGEPVSVPEGYFYSTERDLKGNYPCHNLERHYNSMRRIDRGFGKGWSTGYSWDLTVGVRGKAVVILTSDWKELVYEFDSTVNGYIAVKPSNFAVLKQNDENFILEYPDGIKCFFEPAGRGGSFRITRMEDTEGIRFIYSYGKVTGFLEKVTDKLSNSVSFEYNEVGHITKAKDSAGREVNYAYSSLTGAVTGVKRPDGSAVKYSYDSRGNMSDKVFADGTILVTTYDRSRRVLKQYLDKKLVYEFKYNDKDNSIEYFESGRLVKDYRYNDKKCLTKIISFDNGTEEKIYNDRELVVKYIDQKGRATEFAYDDNGNIAQKVLPNGAKEAFSYDKYSRLVKYTNPLGYSTEVSYNGAGKPEKLTDADGNETAFSYDKNNYLAAMALPDGGNISYVRDDKGNALSVDNNGVVTKYEYDARGNAIKEYSASGLVTEYAYNPDNEPVVVIKKVQADSFEMSYEYDAFGNITKITDPLKRVTSIKWTKGFFNRMEEVTDPSGNIIRLNYNETGRLISKADRNNNGWSYTYDPLGRLTAVEDPAKSRMLAQYDLAGNITAQTDFDGVKKEFEYDDLNRITAIRTEGKTDRKVEYDLAGRAVRVIDANGNATTYKYNKIGKVIEMTDAEGAITRYAYDKMGRVCSVTDGNGNTTNYAYNRLGRIESVTDPLGRKTAYFYDSAGRLSEKALADSSKITYAYDEFGRTAKITYPDDEVVYTYDAVGNVLSAKNRTTDITRRYDTLNRVIEETDSYTHKKIAYSYDPEGNRTALVLDEGYKVAYAYDALNRVSGITQGEEVFKYNYTPGGKLLSKLYPNNTAQNNSYNKYGQLEKIEITGPGNKAIDSFRYTYDLAGNIVKEDNPGAAKEYSYDRIYRLIAEKSGAVTASYSYDPAGNRVKEIAGGKEIPYTYNAANQLIRRGAAEYKYDALGNLIKDDRADYTYNRRNLMTGARVGLSDITYKYDPFGRRIARNNTGYIYDSFSVIRESTTGFIGKRKVSYLLGARLDEILSRRASPVVYYYQDSLGSIRGLTDSSSKLIQAYDYTAFGQEELSSRSKQFLLFDRKISQPYGFTGRPREDLTGLYYYRYRDYNPETGRFLQPDPLGQLPGPNIYSYCSNNPVNWVDPWGLRDIADQVEQVLEGVGQMAGGAALVIGSCGAEVASGGLSSIGSVAGAYIGIGTVSIGFTNLLEGILNSGDQVMPESDTMPGIIAETISGSETVGNLVDMGMPSAESTYDIINVTGDIVDIIDLHQAIENDIQDAVDNSINENNKKQ